MKKLVLTISSIILFFVANTVFADVKIGVIHLNKILTESSQVSEAKNQLKKKFDPREKEIVTAQKNLHADIESYNKNSPTMKGSESKAAQQKIMEQQKKLQEMETSFQSDLTSAQNTAMQKILKQVESVVAKIASEQKLDLVLTKISAAYSDSKLEITDQVIKAMKK